MDLPMTVVLIFILIPCNYCADPVQNVLRDIILSVRAAGERIISSIQLSPSSNLMFQLDPKTSQALYSLNDFINVCPASVVLPPLDGLWFVSHMSRQLLMGSVSEVQQMTIRLIQELQFIDRLSAGGPRSMQKTVGDLLRPTDAPHCLQIAVLADPWPTPFEWSFSLPMGRRSIVGQLMSNDGRRLNFEFGGEIDLRTSLVYASPTDDILVLADTDAMPKCSNIMVLRRNQSIEGRLLTQLTSQGLNPPSNPIMPIPCP